MYTVRESKVKKKNTRELKKKKKKKKKRKKGDKCWGRERERERK